VFLCEESQHLCLDGGLVQCNNFFDAELLLATKRPAFLQGICDFLDPNAAENALAALSRSLFFFVPM